MIVTKIGMLVVIAVASVLVILMLSSQNSMGTGQLHLVIDRWRYTCRSRSKSRKCYNIVDK